MSPIGGEGCAARRRGRSTWRVTESVERLARASRAGDQHTLTANGRRRAGGSGRGFRKYRVRIVGVRFCFVLNVDGASDTVVLIGMVFGKVAGAIADATLPVDNELALANTVADPGKTHIHGFGAFLFDCIVGNARCSAVVGLDRGRRLIVTQFLETCAQGASFFAVVEKGTEFSLGDAGDDLTEDLAEYVNRAVVWWIRIGWEWSDGGVLRPGAEIVKASGLGPCLGGGQIGSVAGHM